jgi:prepilin-type N-terminal cleavage/methylation domain-containing protein
MVKARTSRAARSPRRGFTLVELMVAITAGLFVAVASFALAKQGSKFFQQEARVANAQFSATLGFDRLRADIARAGFLTTANVQRDPFVCPNTNPTAGWPVGMTGLAALRIIAATPADGQNSANGLSPDQITLSGSFASAETFPVRTVLAENAKFQVYLNPIAGAVARSDGIDGGTMGQVFKAGRMLRVLDATGKYGFGAIESYAINAAGQPVVNLKSSPALTFKRPGTTCGVEGLGVGMQANVVNWIRYEIRDLQKSPPTAYQALYSASATAPGDETRRELVRVELDSDGKEMADSLEIVAEYAVDLKFGLTVVSGFATPGNDPGVIQFPIGDPQNYEYTYEPSSSSPVNDKAPHRVRSVRARLAVRSREADRAAGVPAPASAPPGTLFRYSFAGDAGFSRVRTLVADINLPNLASLTW